MKKLINVLLQISKAALASSMLLTSAAFADKQIVTVSPADPAFGESDQAITLSVNYSTDPAGKGATGLGVRLYLNSAQLSPDDISVSEDVGGKFQGLTLVDDTTDDDNDPSTDKKVIVAWSENTRTEGFNTVSVPWPEVEDFSEGVKLFDITLGRASETFVGTSTINFTLDTAAGFDADAPSVAIIFKDDETAPTITLAESSVTIEAVGATTSEDNSTELADFIKTITVSDNKDTLTTDNIEAFLTNADGELEEAPEGFAVGTYEVTLIAVDSSGNKSEPAVVTLTVADTKGPLLSGVADLTLAAVDASGAPSAGQAQATAADLVDGPVEVVLTVGGETLPTNYPIGTTEVTVTATDKSGNSSTDAFTVTVSDQTDPVIVSAAGVTLEATGSEGYVGTADSVIAAIEVSDNVDAAPAVALAAGVDGTFALGSTEVAVTVTDSAGNSVSGTVPVTVVDTTAPEFSGANQLILTVDTAVPVASSDERVVAWLAGVTATDLVDGATTVSNSELPAEFQVGETTVTFTSSDSRGNEAKKDVIVLVAVGPAVKVADSITVVSLDGEAVSSAQSQIAAFIAAATATDFSGGALDVTNDAPDTFAIGETVVTFTAVDAEERQGQNSASVTVIAASGDNDTDGDGIDDLFEVENSLDPNDADDAEADADGDGRSNLDEYLEGKDPNADDVAPVVTAPAAVSAPATGALTKVVLGDASAVDTLDGELTPVADNPGPYAPGSYTVTWTASDAAGNEGSATQSVVVLPQVSTVPKGRTAEGATFDVKVVLNGPASAYPVEVPVTLGGTADLDSDFTVTTDTIVIESGRMGMMTITVLEDDVEEGTEVIEVTLGEPATGAVLGTAITSMINIVEAAEPPALRLDVSQGEQKGRKVAAAGGAVVVMLSITDPNGTHTVEWMSGSEAVVATSEAGAMTFEFDPADLAEGGYEISAMVTDSGIADETFSIGTRVLVSAAEVEADSDGDGVPDSKDTSEESNVIAVNADAGDAAVTADEGVTLILGDAAQASNTAGIAVSEETIAAGGADGSGESSKGEDEDFDYPAGVYDFSVQGLIPGDTVRLVIPIPAGIPADAVARKYTDTDGWYDFVLDEMNMVASAPGEDGACPSVGSEAYVEGLTEGDTCLQLTVEDGGPNDADGVVNGEYKDPSGIAAPAPVRVVEVLKIPASAPKVGGGCSASQGPGDFGLLLLALLGLIGLFRKRLQVPSTR